MQELVVNGVERRTGLPGRTPLLSYLRNDLELNGPKYGCGLAECGSCTVLVDGVAARACVLTLADVQGRAIVTLEGLAPGSQMHPVQTAFIKEAGAQCGYCLNGMIMTTVALLNEKPEPDDAEIREALRYNLCRCGAHVEIFNSVKRAIADMRS
jgi:nicotinate dehydrogenase subunit A